MRVRGSKYKETISVVTDLRLSQENTHFSQKPPHPRPDIEHRKGLVVRVAGICGYAGELAQAKGVSHMPHF